MKTLPHDVSRCTGVITFAAYYDIHGWPVHDTCPQRDTCQRYQALLHTDKAAGIEHYRGIPVHMAVEDCRNKIEVESEQIRD